MVKLNVKLKNHVFIVRRRRVTTGACAPDYSNRKNLNPSAFSQANTVPPLVEDCDEGHLLVSAGEQVRTQTALIKTMDPE